MKLLNIVKCSQCWHCVDNKDSDGITKYAFKSIYVCENSEDGGIPLESVDRIPSWCPLKDSNIFRIIDGWIVDLLSGSSDDANAEDLLGVIQGEIAGLDQYDSL